MVLFDGNPGHPDLGALWRRPGDRAHRRAAVGRRFRWISDAVGASIQICSISDGTQLDPLARLDPTTVQLDPIWL